jgi:hypothetical protein
MHTSYCIRACYSLINEQALILLLLCGIVSRFLVSIVLGYLRVCVAANYLSFLHHDVTNKSFDEKIIRSII